MNILNIDEQTKLVKRDWRNIKKIVNSSEKVWLEVIKKRPEAIKYIQKYMLTKDILLEI